MPTTKALKPRKVDPDEITGNLGHELGYFIYTLSTINYSLSEDEAIEVAEASEEYFQKFSKKRVPKWQKNLIKYLASALLECASQHGTHLEEEKANKSKLLAFELAKKGLHKEALEAIEQAYEWEGKARTTELHELEEECLKAVQTPTVSSVTSANMDDPNSKEKFF